jgi:hypothetical protein
MIARASQSFLAAILRSGAGAAQPVEGFYKGKQIVMLVGTAAGGGYDTYAAPPAIVAQAAKLVP